MKTIVKAHIHFEFDNGSLSETLESFYLGENSILLLRGTVERDIFDHLSRQLKVFGSLVISVPDEMDIKLLNEPTMNKYGWFKK